MHFFEVAGRRYAQFESLRQIADLEHAFSTRPENMSICRDTACAARRRQMTLDFGRDPESMVCCGQVHTSEIAIVRRGMVSAHGVLKGYDAACTDDPAVTLMSFSADCPLVLVFDPRREILGVAHASWRCTTALIVPKLIDTLREEFGSEPSDLVAGIGPSAGPDAYEVGEDVYQASAGLPGRALCFPRHDGRMYFDLWQANRLQLQASGVSENKIEVAGICTMTRTDLFYSYRREGSGCGHFCLMAGIARARKPE